MFKRPEIIYDIQTFLGIIHNKTVVLVGMWDCVAYDKVAGITYKDDV